MRTAQILKLSQLGRDAKLTSATASRYLSLLETSFVLSKLNPYLKNRAIRLIKSPKIYVSDSGLACYMAGIDDLPPDYSEPMMAAMLETYVAQNLLSIVGSRWKEARIYFWSVQGRYEVDFVIEVGRSCMAVEVRSSARWEKKDLAGLEALLAATPHCKAAGLCYNGKDAVQLTKKTWALPLRLLLSWRGARNLPVNQTIALVDVGLFGMCAVPAWILRLYRRNASSGITPRPIESSIVRGDGRLRP